MTEILYTLFNNWLPSKKNSRHRWQWISVGYTGGYVTDVQIKQQGLGFSSGVWAESLYNNVNIPEGRKRGGKSHISCDCQNAMVSNAKPDSLLKKK